MATLTYTQQIDEQTGEIKYVPNTPPTPPPNGGGKPSSRTGDEREIEQTLQGANLEIDPKLAGTLENLLNNAKRLRYNKRLEVGKLDGKRLSAYKTSTRLFKKKAINTKNYQFTFLMDTSGSMLSRGGNTNSSMEMSMEAVARIAKSLEEVNIRSSIFAMNCVFELVKGFDTPFDDTTFTERITENVCGQYEEDGRMVNNCGGTAEWVAYEQTVKYLQTHSPAKVTNVVVILSDGEPGTGTQQTRVTIDGEPFLVPTKGENDRTSTLSHFWDRQTAVKVFGIGINRKARQVPVNRVVSDISTLPDVLSKLLTELML